MTGMKNASDRWFDAFSSVFDAIFTPFHRNYVVLLQPENEELIETN